MEINLHNIRRRGINARFVTRFRAVMQKKTALLAYRRQKNRAPGVWEAACTFPGVSGLAVKSITGRLWADNTEAEVLAPEIRAVGGPEDGTRENIRIEKATAANHAGPHHPPWRARRICLIRTGVMPVPVPDQLPHVPAHVMYTKPIRRQSSYLVGSTSAIPISPRYCVKIVASGKCKGPSFSAAFRRKLPLASVGNLYPVEPGII